MAGHVGVDSLHVNVGDGECTIHLLVKTGPPATSKTKTILKAILVDTGPANASRNGKLILHGAFARIAQQYGVPDLKFDAVVISSWNPDFTGGMFELLNAEMAAVPSGGRLDTFKASWLKYDDKGQPLSLLYAPSTPPSHVPELRLQGSSAGNTKSTISYAYLRPGDKTPTFISGFCQFVYIRGEVLGRDLFAGTPPPVDFVAHPMETPRALLAANPPGDKMPGLYCVLANGISIGSQGSVHTSGSSIGLVIMWNNDGPSISYYGSGTLDAEAEGDVLNWITTPPPPSKEATVTVTSMKLSGRKKSPVASMYCIDTLRPQNLVMFTGSKLDDPRWELIMLLHTFLLSQPPGVASSKPLYVTQYPYYFIKEASDTTSRYVDFSSSGQISYDSFLNKRSAHSDFHSALAQFYERVNKRLRRTNQPELINVYDDYCLWDEDHKQTASERDARDWITQQAEYRWPRISPITACSHPAAGSAVHGLSMEPVNVQGVIDYILVESRDSSQGQQDGKVLVKYFGRNDYECYQVESNRVVPLDQAQLQCQAEAKPIDQVSQRLTSTTPVQPANRSLFSEFPSLSLSQLQNSPPSYTGVLTNTGLYGLETLLLPPEDELGIFQSQKHRDQPQAPSDPATKPRLDQLRALKSTASQGDRNLDDSIASSSLKLQGLSGTPTILKPGDADTFVAALHSLRLSLVGSPGADQDVSKSDELYNWFKMSLAATKLQISGTKEQPVSSMEMQIGEARTFSTAQESVDHAFDLPQPVAGGDPGTKVGVSGLFSQEMDGLLVGQNVLLFGLDASSAPDSLTLPQALTCVGLENTVAGAVTKKLADVTVTLDTQKGSRNAIWFDPGNSYRTVYRLQYRGEGSNIDSLKTWFASSLKMFHIDDILVILKQDSSWIISGSEPSVSQKPQCDIVMNCTLNVQPAKTVPPPVPTPVPPPAAAPVPVQGMLVITEDYLRVDITINAKGSFEQLKAWIETQIGTFDLPSLLSSEVANKVLAAASSFEIRRVSLTMSLDENGEFVAITAVAIDVELLVHAGAQGGNDSVLFLCTYNWAKGYESSLRGVLWLKPPMSQRAEFQKLLPDWEEARQLAPINKDCVDDCLDLKALGAFTSLPEGLPSKITQAAIEIGSSHVAFGGTLTCDPPTSGDPTPKVYLGNLGLRASLTWNDGKLDFAGRLDVDVGLLRCDVAGSVEPARLRGAVIYDKGTWVLGSIIKNFDFSNLYTLLAKKTRVALTVLLKFLKVSYLVLAYKSQDGVQGFQMAGSIELGGARFDLVYTCGQPPAGGLTSTNPFSLSPAEPQPKPADTQVEWDLALSAPGMKDEQEAGWGGLAQSLMGASIVAIPGFVGNIKIGVGNFRMRVREVQNTKTGVDGICLVASAVVDSIEFVFCMYYGLNEGTSGNVKTIVKVEFPTLPSFKLPLVGQIQRPVDEIFFAWVNDRPPKVYRTDVLKQRGLLLTDVEQMNTVLSSLGLKQLTYREIKPKASMTDNDAAIAAGFHFFIIGIDNKHETRVVMDYLFGAPKQQVPVQPGPEKPDTPPGPKKPDTPSDPPKPSGEKRSQAGEIEMTPLKKREYHAPSIMAPSQASTADTGSFSDDDHSTHGGFHPAGKTVFDDGDTGDEKPSAKQHVRTNPASQTQPVADPVVNPGDKPAVDPKVDPKPAPVVKPDDKTAVAKKGLGRRKYPGQVAPYKTQQNTLTISNLGLEYSNNTIYLHLDAKCVIGPVGASLIGLCFSITFGRDDTLENLTVDNVAASFEGLVFSLDLPAVLAAGAFCHTNSLTRTLRPGTANAVQIKTVDAPMAINKKRNQKPGDDDDGDKDILATAKNGDKFNKEYASTYSGGAILGLKSWVIQGAGFYESRVTEVYNIVIGPPPAAPGKDNKLGPQSDTPVTQKVFESQDESTSLFIFIKWEGMITLEFATLTGIMGAFGYNMKLRWPKVEEVKDFPFVGMNRAAANPQDQLKDLIDPNSGGWVSPKVGEKWLAAGLKVMITQVVAVDTAMIVQWSPEFRIGLVGVGVCELPSVDVDKKFARVEVGFKATLDPGTGAFRLEAQISPDSFIFDPNCHLRGGLALCVWWTPTNGSADDLSGDWVFTLGGYHKSFQIPEHYPQPARLAIEWKCDDHVSIRGEAYFAITPKVMMAGGMLSITLSCGNLSAWFNAWLDLLINYHPFKFVADGGVTIGVSYTLDLLFVSTNIKVQIGATLHIEGPPVRGVVHVDFWVFGFSINFGSDDQPEPEEVDLEKFYNLVMAAGINAQKQDQSGGKTIQDNCHTFNAQSGLLPSSSDATPAAGAPWAVRSGTFVFSVGCQFPISGLSVDDTDVPVANEAPLYGKPMKSTNEISSQLAVRVFKKTARRADGSLGPYDKIGWKLKTSKKGLPKALWEEYNADQDPDLKGNQVSSLLDGSKPSTQLTTDVVLTPPLPEIADDNLLPISATELQKEEAFSDDDPLAPHFPPLEQAHPQFAPATLDPSAGHYDVAATMWSKPRPQAQSLVDFWAESMLWDLDALKKEDMAVCAEPPAMYIGKRDSLWMRAPSLAVGA